MLLPGEKTTEKEGIRVFFFSVPSETLLLLGTASMLLALVGGKAVAETIQAVGQASEEVFRGDRLPILQFPTEKELSAS